MLPSSCYYITIIYVYTKFNEPQKLVLGVRTGTYFTLPDLGAGVRAAAIANFYQINIAKNMSCY